MAHDVCALSQAVCICTALC